jgi:hypothetical protein
MHDIKPTTPPAPQCPGASGMTEQRPDARALIDSGCSLEGLWQSKDAKLARH